METSKMAFQNLENLNSTTLLCVVDVIFKYICIKTLLGFLVEIFLSSSFQRFLGKSTEGVWKLFS